MSVKKNVVANYAGQGWRALMQVAFIPLYIKYLGIEAYGLIGIYALLQGWLALLDMGMKPALGREMARFTAGAHTAQSIRNLLRSVEILGLIIAAIVALGVWASSGLLASHWVTAKHLSQSAVSHSFAAMGVVISFRFIEDIYMSSIVGLQRQVLQNAVIITMATARGLGAVCVLKWISPTIGAYFLWQALISLLTVAGFAWIVYRSLPPASAAARFSSASLLEVRNFAAGMMLITLLSLLLSQVDKILLARLVSLDVFGYYALAAVVAAALPTLTAPITGALYPRFTQLLANGDNVALRSVYHQGAQLVTVLAGSAAVVLMVFAERFLRLWSGNPQLAGKVAPLLVVLILAALCNALMWIPYQMQLAYGWTSLTIKVNAVALCLLVPVVIWAVPRYGALGGAWASVAVNAGYLLFSIPLMHRRLLPLEKWRWYTRDVAIPLAAAAVMAFVCKSTLPREPARITEIGVLAFTSLSVVTAAVLVAPAVRKPVMRQLQNWVKAPLLEDIREST